MNYFFGNFLKFFVLLLFSIINFKLLHYRGNYKFTLPYKSGPTCGDCPNACEDKLCKKVSNTPFLKLKMYWRALTTLLSPLMCIFVSVAANPCPYTDKYVTVLTWSNAGATAAVSFPLGVLPPANAPVRLFQCLHIQLGSDLVPK